MFLDQPLDAVSQSLITRGVCHAARIARADPALNSTPERLLRVCGIVSARGSTQPIEELRSANPYEAADLEIAVFDNDTELEKPHQKLVVVDGLLALTGSANLTENAWRNAAKDLDAVEVVSAVDEVMTLNNRYFSPLWARRSLLGETIEMRVPPD